MIALDVTFSDETLHKAIFDTLAQARFHDEAYVRVLVTRGVGELTYDPKATPSPTLAIIVKPHVDPPDSAYRDGVAVAIVDTIRNHPGSVNPMIKSNNLMNNALAMQQALRRGAFEGVMRNYRGELTECTTANLFIVRDGVVLTPPLDAGILPGITREFIFEIGRAVGVDVHDAVLRDEDLYGADEAFLTSTTREALPITIVDDRAIGTGKPGLITLKLLDEFRKAARSGVREHAVRRQPSD
jgi:branched-chain amino acid aminotransferase